MLRGSSASVTETPLAAIGERVLRGGVCRAMGLLGFEGEDGALGKSSPLPPHGLASPCMQLNWINKLIPCTKIYNKEEYEKEGDKTRKNERPSSPSKEAFKWEMMQD